MHSRDLYAPSSNAGWLPWGALAPVLCLVMVVITQLAGSLLLEPLVTLDATGNPTDPPGLIAFTIVPFGLLLLVLGESLRNAVLGTLDGVLLAIPTSRLLTSFLYQIPAADPISFGAAAGVLVVAAVLASLSPALRAMRTDPAVVLRN